MEYEGTPIRPPSEADSIILQVTVGCSHNRCAFCGAYRGVRFRIKSAAEIDRDLAFAARHCRQIKRVFLADGDVLSLSTRRLAELLRQIRRALPWVRRISAYGNAKNLRHKSAAELEQLKKLGLTRIYMGLESGDEHVLCQMNKGAGTAAMLASAQAARQAGIFLSVTALLGLGGVEGSRQHAEKTGELLAAMRPNQVALLALMPVPGTELAGWIESGRFRLPSPSALLDEMALILERLKGSQCQFHANHASNYLPLAGRLPRDHACLSRAIAAARAGRLPLRPERARFL